MPVFFYLAQKKHINENHYKKVLFKKSVWSILTYKLSLLILSSTLEYNLDNKEIYTWMLFE